MIETRFSAKGSPLTSHLGSRGVIWHDFNQELFGQMTSGCSWPPLQMNEAYITTVAPLHRRRCDCERQQIAIWHRQYSRQPGFADSLQGQGKAVNGMMDCRHGADHTLLCRNCQPRLAAYTACLDCLLKLSVQTACCRAPIYRSPPGNRPLPLP